MLAPGGRLIVVDLAAHDRAALAERLAHRWPGFADAEIAALFAGPDLLPGPSLTVAGPLDVRLWTASLQGAAPSRPATLEFAQ